MTQLKANYIVFATIVACITVHSWRQINNGNMAKPGQKAATSEVDMRGSQRLK